MRGAGSGGPRDPSMGTQGRFHAQGGGSAGLGLSFTHKVPEDQGGDLWSFVTLGVAVGSAVTLAGLKVRASGHIQGAEPWISGHVLRSEYTPPPRPRQPFSGGPVPCTWPRVRPRTLPSRSGSGSAVVHPAPRRCVSLKTPARTRPTTATGMLSVSTWATSATPCSSASAGRATRVTGSSVGKIRTWTAGPTRTWSAPPTPPTTASRWGHGVGWGPLASRAPVPGGCALDMACGSTGREALPPPAAPSRLPRGFLRVPGPLWTGSSLLGREGHCWLHMRRGWKSVGEGREGNGWAGLPKPTRNPASVSLCQEPLSCIQKWSGPLGAGGFLRTWCVWGGPFLGPLSKGPQTHRPLPSVWS